MNYIHYKDIVNEFRDFTSRHPYFNLFINASESDFNASESVYPAAILVPQQSSAENNTINLNFNLIVTDILTGDRDNTQDVYSATLDALRDFLAYFTDNPDLEWSFSETATLTPFEEKYDDILAGWMLNFTVIVPNSMSVCNLPLND